MFPFRLRILQAGFLGGLLCLAIFLGITASNRSSFPLTAQVNPPPCANFGQGCGPGVQCCSPLACGSWSKCCVAAGNSCTAASECCAPMSSCTDGKCRANAGGAVCGNGVKEGTEACDGEACCGSDCKFKSSSTVCRASAGICDIVEKCTGDSATCPADKHELGTTVCRVSAGSCDVAENCDGSADCPADTFDGTLIVCRASSNAVCDPAEKCSGNSAACPADINTCPGGLCAGQPAGTVCRVAAGVCDKAETCDGNSNNCPADSFEASTIECRAANGACDIAESCTGSSAACPGDGFVAAGTSCRASVGACDRAETCDGNSNTCPTDSFEASTVVCRASADVCDRAETCSGSSAACPVVDTFQPPATVCRPSVGICDREERCPGNSAACPTDTFEPGTKICRFSTAACDPPEKCLGNNASCPVDQHNCGTSLCGNNQTDTGEQCDGGECCDPSCKFRPARTPCTDDGKICTLDQCGGANAACAHPPGNVGTVCRPSTAACDPVDTCTGNDALCPADTNNICKVRWCCAAGQNGTDPTLTQTDICIGTMYFLAIGVTPATREQRSCAGALCEDSRCQQWEQQRGQYPCPEDCSSNIAAPAIDSVSPPPSPVPPLPLPAAPEESPSVLQRVLRAVQGIWETTADYLRTFLGLRSNAPAPVRDAPQGRPSSTGTTCTALTGNVYGPMKHKANEDGSTTHTLTGGGSAGSKGNIIFMTVQFLVKTAPNMAAQGELTMRGPNDFFLKFTLTGPPGNLPSSLEFLVVQAKGHGYTSFEGQKGTLTLAPGPVAKEVEMYTITLGGRCPEGSPRQIACSGPQPGPNYVCARQCGPPVVHRDDPPPGCAWTDPGNAVADSSAGCGGYRVVPKTKEGVRVGCPICLASQTRIATPSGEMRVTDVKAGTIVWTQDADGKRTAAPVRTVRKTLVPSTHRVVHLALADGRDVFVSPGHPTNDRRAVGDLHAGDLYNGSRVKSAELVSYTDGYTYDLLPEGPTGFYWADSILLGSTLR